MSAISTNVTLRTPQSGGVDRPVTYEELDQNFQELKNVIDETNDHIASVDAHDATSINYDNVSSGLDAVKVQQAIDEIYDKTRETFTDEVLSISKTYLESVYMLPTTIPDVYTFSGSLIQAPASTIIYESNRQSLHDNTRLTIELKNATTGNCSVDIKGFNETGVEVTAGSFVVNGTSRTLGQGFFGSSTVLIVRLPKDACKSYQIRLRTNTAQLTCTALTIRSTIGWI